MTAPVDNGVPVRPTATHRLKDSDSEVQVHRVTDETAGEVQTIDGTRRVGKGDVLVSTPREGVWDVYDEKAFGDMGTDEVDAQPDVRAVDFVDDEDDEGDKVEFDPSTRNASEVRDYLARDDVSDSEKERVRQAERDGLNRSSALR